MFPLLFFAGTLFVSAFLLFLVQPIIGKMILPKLGGTPQVWNTCMVFFQSALLAGYAYTHTSSTRLKLRIQLLMHGILLFLPLIVLLPTPFNVQDWSPSNLGGNPIPDTLLLLSLIVGLPFLIVATSAPLLQKWFAHTGHPAAEDPYFLYAASNAGSMTALIAYPAVVEPFFGLRDQAWVFTYGYFVFLLLVLGCAALVWVTGKEAYQTTFVPEGPALDVAPAAAPAPGSSPAPSTAVSAEEARSALRKGPPPRTAPRSIARPEAERASDEMTAWRRLWWIGLAFVPSSFMLGLTAHITTDLSPNPLFWLVPLTLYLGSFILVFSRWPVLWVDQPHKIVLVAQPVAIVLMILLDQVLHLATTQIWTVVFFGCLAFFLTALACHGELAKDRPSTRHLTEYYLLMSVGGMLGGVFNGLVAPVMFKHLYEFNIAIILACFMRPRLVEEGWTDRLLMDTLEDKPQAAVKGKGGKGQAKPVLAEGPTSYGLLMDFALPIVLVVATALLAFVVMGWFFPPQGQRSEREEAAYNGLAFGIPLFIATLYYGRPIRFGLAIAAIILVHSFYTRDRSIYSDRSYFGIISVKESSAKIDSSYHKFRQLVHGHINHGMNFMPPESKSEMGNANKDFSRLATTYYHRYGPAGVVMEKYNWFPGPQNTFWADARMPASLVGLGASPLGSGVNLPLEQIVDLWSEPPFATIGLGTGTMASYARAFQHCHFYEIDNHVRRLSLPEDGSDPYFTFLQQGLKRRAHVQVLMGDARLRMAMPYQNHYFDPERGGGPKNFYYMMVVDAFSSDAIPAHLITKEGIRMYFDHLAEEGILCVHTSNRFVDLPKVVAAVAKDLGLYYRRGHDLGNDEKQKVDTGRYSSEWVMVARKDEYLNFKTPPNSTGNENRNEDYWSTPVAYRGYLWTDDHTNLLAVFKWPWSRH